jgi:hypothetical protein
MKIYRNISENDETEQDANTQCYVVHSFHIYYIIVLCALHTNSEPTDTINNNTTFTTLLRISRLWILPTTNA